MEIPGQLYVEINKRKLLGRLREAQQAGGTLVAPQRVE
jgi:hypothetical protein